MVNLSVCNSEKSVEHFCHQSVEQFVGLKPMSLWGLPWPAEPFLSSWPSFWAEPCHFPLICSQLMRLTRDTRPKREAL